MSKIQEVIIEPSKIRTGNTFKIKIKAIRYLTHGEVKLRTVGVMKQFSIGQVKGEV